MASVVERPEGSGRWIVRVFVGTDPGTGHPKQVQKTVYGTKRKAENVGAELERGYRGVGVSALQRTVAVALKEWRDDNEIRWARSTKTEYKNRAAQVCEDTIFARIRLDKLRRGDVDDWVKRMRADGTQGGGRGTKPVREAAIKNRVAVVRSAVAHAVDCEHLTVNPIAGYKLRQPARDEEDVLDDDVVAACIEAAARRDPKSHLGERLAAMTGARRSELAGLRWTDRTGVLLDIRRQVYVENGVRHVTERLKTKRSRRIVELDAKTLRLWEQVEAAQTAPSTYVFGEPGDDRPPSPGRLYRIHRLAMKDAGFEPGRLHALRHWNASVGVDTAPVSAVASRLGNSTDTVNRVYAHTTTEARKRLANDLSNRLDATDHEE